MRLPLGDGGQYDSLERTVFLIVFQRSLVVSFLPHGTLEIKLFEK